MNIFPRWMYHKSKEPVLAMNESHCEELKKQGFGWHGDIFKEENKLNERPGEQIKEDVGLSDGHGHGGPDQPKKEHDHDQYLELKKHTVKELQEMLLSKGVDKKALKGKKEDELIEMIEELA